MKLDKGVSSQNGRPTCVTCGKRHYWKCLAGTIGCYGCEKDYHKLRDFPTIVDRGREGKQVAPNLPKDDAQKKRQFYALRTRGSKSDEDDDDSESLYILGVMSFF